MLRCDRASRLGEYWASLTQAKANQIKDFKINLPIKKIAEAEAKAKKYWWLNSENCGYLRRAGGARFSAAVLGAEATSLPWASSP